VKTEVRYFIHRCYSFGRSLHAMMMPSPCELHSGNLWWEEIDDSTFNMVMLTISKVTKHHCGCVEISENEHVFRP
jgi:hypothetical protein